jgi:hypothetical protein
MINELWLLKIWFSRYRPLGLGAKRHIELMREVL